jgi:hypothetical protein
MDNFHQVIAELTLAQARLRALPVKNLSDERRRDRSRQLRQLREAVETLVLVQFENLSAEAQESAASLAASTAKLKADLDKLKNVVAVIATVGAALGQITAIVKLFA